MACKSGYGGGLTDTVRIADKGGKPEDHGLGFPDYACHGGGEYHPQTVQTVMYTHAAQRFLFGSTG